MEQVPLFERVYGDSYKQSNGDIFAGYKYEIALRKYRDHGGGEFETVKIWRRLTLELLVKYDWYFRTWAARQQIQYPKNRFFFIINREATEQDIKDQRIKTTKDKLTAAKAKVTQITNALTLAKQKWNKIFPIEDEPDYQKAQAKLFTKKQLVISLQKELDDLMSK